MATKKTPRKPRKVTIVEVARRAGVSLGTVSRVINANASVREDLRRRVLRAAQALGYAPNPAAQAIRGRSTRAIGVMVPDLSNPLFASTVAGAEDVLYRAGYHMIVSGSRYGVEKEREILTLFQRRRFDGLLVAPSREDDADLEAALREVSVPTVLLERASALPLDSVATDHFAGAEQAIAYLLELGHRRIGFVTVTQAALTGRQRGEAYVAAHRAANVPVDAALLSFDGLTPGAAYQAAYRMLVSRRPPTALVAGATQVPEVLKAVRSLRLAVPKRISLVSIGDTDAAQLHQPPLTAVRWDLEKVGAAAAELLLARLTGAAAQEGPRRIVLPTELVVRSSCAAPATRK